MVKKSNTNDGSGSSPKGASDKGAGNKSANDKGASRRDFLKKSSAAVMTTGVLASSLAIERASYAQSNETIKIGLVGCGGRGSGAAAQALRADKNIKLVAMCDAFKDRLELSLKNLKRQAEVRNKVMVDEDHKFDGFDGYKKLINSGIDVVLFATPPHFRPLQVEYAVKQGKHCFIEKPVCVDTAGYHRMWKACQDAKQKGLAICSGLCYRYDAPKREVMKRIHDGAIGDIVSMQSYFYTGGLWHRGNDPKWSKMEYQMRNWMYFYWLSGDHIVEQHVHSLDKCMWANQDELPIKVMSTGGRQVRTEEKYGNIYDHFYNRFEFKNGVTLHSASRQFQSRNPKIRLTGRVDDIVVGTKGRAHLQRHLIEGANPYRWRRRAGQKTVNMYDQEHIELFASIRNGKPVYNGDYMCNSTMLAIQARTSAYTGLELTWDKMLKSKMDLTPPSYDMALNDLPTPSVPIPGLTPFV